jgi:hypothetical protein
MPTHEGVGPDDCEDLKDRREPTIKLNEEPAIVVRKSGPVARRPWPDTVLPYTLFKPDDAQKWGAAVDQAVAAGISLNR